MSNPVKPQAPMTKNGQPFYPLTTIDQVLDSGGNRLSADSTIQVYTHTKKNNVHNFVGTGANGRAKITADFASGDTFQVNGTAVTAYWGTDAPDADLIANGRWVTFIVDGNTINFKPGGGLSNSKLARATATASNVLSGKTFYSGDKTLKTGSISSKGAESVTLNANTTSKTFNTSGKYCTGNMTVSTSTKAAESVTLNPGGSKTFDTAGKLCTGNMSVSVNHANAVFAGKCWANGYANGGGATGSSYCTAGHGTYDGWLTTNVAGYYAIWNTSDDFSFNYYNAGVRIAYTTASSAGGPQGTMKVAYIY